MVEHGSEESSVGSSNLPYSTKKEDSHNGIATVLKTVVRNGLVRVRVPHLPQLRVFQIPQQPVPLKPINMS